MQVYVHKLCDLSWELNCEKKIPKFLILDASFF